MKNISSNGGYNERKSSESSWWRMRRDRKTTDLSAQATSGSMVITSNGLIYCIYSSKGCAQSLLAHGSKKQILLKRKSPSNLI